MAWIRVTQVLLGPWSKQGAPPSNGVLINGPTQAVQSAYGQGGPTALSDFIPYQGLRINFNVTKYMSQDPAYCKMRIYNLSQNSFSSYVKRNNVVQVCAGYADEMGGAISPPVLFLGTIRYARRFREGPDWITEVEADSASFDLGARDVNFSFPGLVPLSTILNALATTLGCGVVNPQVFARINFQSGYAFSGKVSYCLRELCDKVGCDFSLDGQGGIILIPQSSYLLMPQGSAGPLIAGSSNPTYPGQLLTATTGLLLSPEPIYDSTMNAAIDQESETTQQWKITSLLFPHVGPNSVLCVQSPSIPTQNNQAFFRVIQTDYAGDNWDGDWKNEMLCQQIDSAGNLVGVAP